ncbi:MAG: hypothetical protein AAF292_17830 [Pseudomonadota bacterium]
MKLQIAIINLAVLLFAGSASADLYRVKGNAPNWCEMAATYLEPVGSRPAFKCAADGSMVEGKRSLCIRLNNYGCIWQRRATWPGTDIKPGNNGAHDGRNKRNGHSVFRDPVYSLAAKFHWFATKRDTSALSLAGIYLPWCDTLGSVPRKGDFYRSCDLKPSQRQASRNYCEKPVSGQPTSRQCASCNCPSVLATKWVEGSGFSVRDQLPLIGADGQPSELLVEIALRNSVNELGGYRPNARAVAEAQALYADIYK